jgi:hypothetical protein
VRTPGSRKSFIDVMENVFAGVHISTDDETPRGVADSDLRARPWLSGLTMTAVRVRLSREDEDPPEK